MITDEELMKKIEEVTKDFHGDITHLSEAVGMIVQGRLFGWRVMRLVSSRRCWTFATKLFGDPKLLMLERGKYYHKSLGMKIIDATGDYWEYIKGHKSITQEDRKSILHI
jgi:hypothetical protein